MQKLYQKTLTYNIYPRIMTKVNVSASVGMSRQWGKCLQQWRNVRDSGGNVCDSGGTVRNSGEIEYALTNLRLEIVIENFA